MTTVSLPEPNALLTQFEMTSLLQNAIDASMASSYWPAEGTHVATLAAHFQQSQNRTNFENAAKAIIKENLSLANDKLRTRHLSWEERASKQDYATKSLKHLVMGMAAVKYSLAHVVDETDARDLAKSGNYGIPFLVRAFPTLLNRVVSSQEIREWAAHNIEGNADAVQGCLNYNPSKTSKSISLQPDFFADLFPVYDSARRYDHLGEHMLYGVSEGAALYLGKGGSAKNLEVIARVAQEAGHPEIEQVISRSIQHHSACLQAQNASHDIV